MLDYPEINPVAVALGPLKVHWYGLMYLIGFAGGWWLGRLRARRPDSGWTPQQVDDLLFYIVLGVVLGGRLGYVLFYTFPVFVEHPLTLFRIWEGGMSFHGGLLGVLLAMWLYGRRRGRSFFRLTDFIAPLVTIGLGAGRIGNFINGELWGRVTDLPWGMRLPCRWYPQYCEGLAGMELSPPVHPTQLYEALLEGLVLFLTLWVYSSRPRPTMAVSGLFLICYGVFRFGVEFVRIPDAHLGYLLLGWVTMGQILSLPMIIAGVILFWLAHNGLKQAK